MLCHGKFLFANPEYNTASTFYIVDACVFTASDEFLIIKLPYTHTHTVSLLFLHTEMSVRSHLAL